MHHILYIMYGIVGLLLGLWVLGLWVQLQSAPQLQLAPKMARMYTAGPKNGTYVQYTAGPKNGTYTAGPKNGTYTACPKNGILRTEIRYSK